MIRITLDATALLAELRAKASGFRRDTLAGFERAAEAVVALFRRKWLSGWFGTDLGLNIQTRNLYQSLRSNAERDGDAILAEVSNEGADYWYYHEHPQGARPQRLHLEEEFVIGGGPLFVGEIDRAWEGVAS